MKINTKKSNRTLIVLLAVVALLITGATGYWLLRNNTAPLGEDESAINYDEATDEQKNAGDEAKKRTVANNEEGNASSSAPSEKSTLTLTITTATVQDETVYIRSEIEGVFNQGTCQLTLTQGNKSIARSASIQALAQSSTCKGFNIPVKELAEGTWQVSLKVLIEDKAGLAETTIDI